jgi:hypothetical protein
MFGYIYKLFVSVASLNPDTDKQIVTPTQEEEFDDDFVLVSPPPPAQALAKLKSLDCRRELIVISTYFLLLSVLALSLLLLSLRLLLSLSLRLSLRLLLSLQS